jgi:hypothetical protein
MNDSTIISSSFVFDKNNSRFSILNIYDDDIDDINANDNYHHNSFLKKQIKQSNMTIEKKELAFQTNKCYCSIM